MSPVELSRAMKPGTTATAAPKSAKASRMSLEVFSVSATFSPRWRTVRMKLRESYRVDEGIAALTISADMRSPKLTTSSRVLAGNTWSSRMPSQMLRSLSSMMLSSVSTSALRSAGTTSEHTEK